MSSRKMTKMENINDAVLITNDELGKILKRLNATEENEEKLRILEETKVPYLFQSDHLAEILKVTQSVRTRINMMGIVGPRLTDPKARMDYFLGLFRYAEEKAQAEEILKARMMTLNSSIFNKGAAELIRGGIGRGGGRNATAAGRGRGRGNGASSSSQSSSSGLKHTQSSISCADVAEDQAAGGCAAVNCRSADSFDNHGGRFVQGADSVFADLDDLSGTAGSHDRKLSVDAGGDSSDDEASPGKHKKHLHRPGAELDSRNATDTESASSDDLDGVKHSSSHRRSQSMRSSLDITAGLSSQVAFGTPPSKMTGAMNPLQAAKSAPSAASDSSKSRNDKRIASLRLQTSPHQSGSWDSHGNNANREDASKFVQAGTVLAKLSSFSAAPTTPTHSQSVGSRARQASPEKLNVKKIDEAMQQAKIKVANMFARSPEPTTPALAGSGQSVNNDHVAKCAAILKISRETFLALSPEESVGKSATGDDLFSYQELVRRNYVKEYQGLMQSELEKHLNEKEFEKVFDKKPPQFYAQPKWKQLDQKKKALLF